MILCVYNVIQSSIKKCTKFWR